MSFLERTAVEPSDAELITRVRGGDKGAYGDLFARHREAATRLARSLTRGADADDLVSEAFAKVFNVLLGGGGPDLAFRAYLLTALRRLHIDRARAVRRSTPTDDIETLDSGVAFVDPAVAGFDSGAAAKAFKSLPERWQLVLWHLEVEGQKPAEIAPLLGMSPNSVSVLAYRAREGLRQAFLQMHAADLVSDGCEWTRDKLGAYVRKAASRRDAEKVESHLQGCRPCTAVYLELTEVNSSLGALLGPLVLGGAAAAYLGGGAAVGSTTILGTAASRVVEFVAANTQAAVVTGAAATVAVAGTVGVVATRDDPAPKTTSAHSSAHSSAQAPAITSTPRTPAPRPRATKVPERPVGIAPAVGDPAPGAPAVSAVPDVAPPASPPVEPSPEPGPEQAPEDAIEASPEPPAPPKATPTPPAVPAVDASVVVTLKRNWRHLLLHLGGRHVHSVFTVTTSGVPEGATTSLALTFSNPLFPRVFALPRGCERANATSITCSGVTNGSRTFRVRTRSLEPVTITATLGQVAGDRHRDNDSASVVSRPR